MSYKSILFFLFLLSLIIYLYFNSFYIDLFQKYFSFILLIIGIISVFLYPISSKIYNGDSLKSVEKFLVKKYKKKS
jgi:hypothetical protein